MEHVWTVFCRRMLVDTETNQLSLMDTVDGIHLPLAQTPEDTGTNVFAFPCALASYWTRSDAGQPEKGTIRISVLDPSGAAVGFTDPSPMVLEIDLSVRWGMRVHNTYTALPLHQAGVYRFITEMKVGKEWIIVSDVPYRLRIQLDDKGMLPAGVVADKPKTKRSRPKKAE